MPLLNYTITKRVYIATSSRSLLLFNFNPNAVNVYANLSTCTIFAVPLAFRRAESCGVLRRIASCCGENDATCRAAPRGSAVIKHIEYTLRVFTVVVRHLV